MSSEFRCGQEDTFFYGEFSPLRSVSLLFKLVATDAYYLFWRFKCTLIDAVFARL